MTRDSHHHHLIGEASPPTAASPHGSQQPRVVSVNMDSMVVIWAILLCALLCALCLKSVARCTLCYCIDHNHNRQEIGPLGRAAYVGAANGGLKRSTIRQIPTTMYQNGARVMSTDCMICLGEFTEGEKIKVLPKCKHGYHSKCIDTWLVSQSTCPTCRESLSEVSMGIVNLASLGA